MTALKLNTKEAIIFTSKKIIHVHPNKNVESPISPPENSILAHTKEGIPILIHPLAENRYGVGFFIITATDIMSSHEIKFLEKPSSGGETGESLKQVYIIFSELEKSLKNAQKLLDAVKVMVENDNGVR